MQPQPQPKSKKLGRKKLDSNYETRFQSFRVTQQTKDRLESAAARFGMIKSDLVRTILDQWLDTYEQ